jgi:ABC-type transporter MlaC component
MKTRVICFLVGFLITNTFAQVAKSDNVNLTEKDTTMMDTVQLEEVVISKVKISAEERKYLTTLRNRVYKTYPYAKIASEKLLALNKGMSNLKTEKDKKKYFKIVESYLTNEFEEKLKKLSMKQGQILVKLIHRQTGTTTFELIKSLKSGWKAFWANITAKMFDINLKTEYKPFEVNEDYLIESILTRAFEIGRLERQEPAKPINYDELMEHWDEKLAKTD